MERVHVHREIQQPLIVMRLMIQKQSIVGAEVHSEAKLPSTSHQNPNSFSQHSSCLVSPT